MNGNLHLAWATLALRALHDSGVREFVLSPGSRSTPLALAAAQCEGLRVTVVLDERTAGFVALGMARATGAPAAVLCTSGTALAHYGPAVLEAAQSYVPLVVLSADRPWESYDAHAPQTVDQVKLFGSTVRHYAELGLPEPDAFSLRSVGRVVAQVVAASRAPVPGPVHINARFRKPLEPVDAPLPEPWEPAYRRALAAPITAFSPALSLPDRASIQRLARAVAAAERPWILAGPSVGPAPGGALREALHHVVSRGALALWAESTSDLRWEPCDEGARPLAMLESLSRVPGWWETHGPDLVLQVGLPLVGMGVSAKLGSSPPAQHFVLAPYGWPDPCATATELLRGDLLESLRALGTELDGCAGASLERTNWLETLARHDAIARESWQRAVAPDAALDEGSVVRTARDELPAGSVVLVGNSNPVRDLDLFARPEGRPVRVLHQRGASGIDGLVAGATGSALALGDSVPGVLCLLGDVSLLHDLGSLHLLGHTRAKVCVLVVQNNGGRIFEQLPLGAKPALRDAFEQYFLTPQDVDFAHAAAQARLRYARVDSVSWLSEALRAWQAQQGPMVLEAVVPPEDATRRRRAGFAAVTAALRSEVAS